MSEIFSMSGNDLFFTPEDFESVVSLEDLTSYIEQIIIQIRTGSNLSNLSKEIDEMNKISETQISKDSSILELLTAYKHIQSLSLKLRLELNKYIQLETYDSILYAFYYNNQRFSTDNLSVDWLFVNNQGELRLMLDKATEDLKNSSEYIAKEKINNIFDVHYQNYLKSILSQYKGTIGKGKLNRGHIAEAYESHISEHHTKAYNLLNINEISPTVMEQMVALLDLETQDSNENWNNHESADLAWQHIRNSMGTQRGTVAGDVGRFQVKQGTSSSKNIYSSQVRISSLSNLKKGIEAYSSITNPLIPTREVAKKIAMYMSEPVSKRDKNIQAYIANQEIVPEIDKTFKLRHI